MKAFGIKEYKPIGDFSSLLEYEVPKPTLVTSRDLLIQVKAVATNPVDAKIMGNRGLPYGDIAMPFDQLLIPGWDASGIVEQVACDCTLFRAGDEVWFAGSSIRPGAFAEYVVVDERIVGRKPKNLSFSQAASAPLTTITAWEALMDLLKIPMDVDKNKDKSILITGGAGGVATVAVELAKKVLGLKTVIGTSSRPETATKILELGADYTVNHREPYIPQIHALGIEQVDYIFHCVDLSEALLQDFVTLLKPMGGLCSVVPTVSNADLMMFKPKSLCFSVEFMYTRANLNMIEHHDILMQVADLYEREVLSCRQSLNLPLTRDNLVQALEFQISGKAIGKTTLYFTD